MWTTEKYPHTAATVPHDKALQLVCFGLHGPVAETSFRPHTALAVSWFAFHGGSARLRKAFSLAGLGQTRAAERGSRSVVYLTDSVEYSGGDVELPGKGSTPEGLAKNWSTEAPR